MFTESNEKLQQIKELLVELLAELEMTLEEVRAMRRDHAASDRENGKPDWVQKIYGQRDTLITVALLLADMRFDAAREMVVRGREAIDAAPLNERNGN